MKIITLTKGYECLVDDEDFEFLMQWKWRVRLQGNPYAIRTFRDNGKDSTIAMHRVIGSRMGFDLTFEVDHKSGNTLDNRRGNLRACERQKSQYNRHLFSNNKIGLKGVYQAGSRFRAQIRVDGKKINLGRFDSPEDAHQAYVEASIHYHGEFRRI